MANEWTWTYQNHEIRVATTKNDNLRLYIDGELLDSTNDVYASGDDAALVGVFGEDSRIDVFASPTGELAVRVNGEFITRAYAAAS